MSYAIGLFTDRNLVKGGAEIDVAGMQETIPGKRPLMAETEIRSLMSGWAVEIRQKWASDRTDAEVVNRKRSDDYRIAFVRDASVKRLSNNALFIPNEG